MSLELPMRSSRAGLDARGPSAAKAALVVGSNGMAEAMPLQSTCSSELCGKRLGRIPAKGYEHEM